MPDQDNRPSPADNPSQHSQSQSELLPPATTDCQIGTQPQQRSDNQQTTATEMRREFRWFEWSSIAINLALAIIGVCALRVYNGQLKVMIGQLGEMARQYPELQKSATAAKDASDVARDTLTTVQRPFITFSPSATVRTKPVPVTWKNPSGMMWIFTFPIRNTGTTPTSRMFDHLNVYYSGSKPIDETFDYRDVGDLQPFNIVLPPNDTVYSGTGEVTGNQLWNLQLRLSKGEYWHGPHVYFYGWVRYRDMLPYTPEHITKFCFDLTHFDQVPSQAAVSDHLGVEMSFCHQHNCMDNECKKEKGPPYDFVFPK